MTQAFVVDAIRTPFGRYGGALSGVRTDDLGAIPIKALMARNPNVDWAAVSDVVYGCANQAGEDNRNVARMASLLAGLPTEVPGATVNRLCGSSLDALGTAARAIKAGEAGLMIAGGVESMSRAPFVMPKAESAFSRANAVYDTTIGWRFVNRLMKAQYGIDCLRQLGVVEFDEQRAEVLDDALRRHRLGDGDQAVLPVPGQHDLSRRRVVLRRERDQQRVLQQALARTQRRPRLRDDLVRCVQLPQRLLRQVRRELDLVDHRHDAGLVDEPGQLLLRKVRNADRGDAPLLLQLDERLPGLDERVLGRHGPVDEVQVQHVEAELAHGGVEGAQRRVVALFEVPQLGRHEDVLARHVGLGECPADAGLVAVDGRGVDVSVTRVQSQPDHALGDVVFDLPDAVAQLGDGVAVTEGDGG